MSPSRANRVEPSRQRAQGADRIDAVQVLLGECADELALRHEGQMPRVDQHAASSALERGKRVVAQRVIDARGPVERVPDQAIDLALRQGDITRTDAEAVEAAEPRRRGRGGL